MEATPRTHSWQLQREGLGERLPERQEKDLPCLHSRTQTTICRSVDLSADPSADLWTCPPVSPQQCKLTSTSAEKSVLCTHLIDPQKKKLFPFKYYFQFKIESSNFT